MLKKAYLYLAVLALPSLPVFSQGTEEAAAKHPVSKIGKYQFCPTHQSIYETYLVDTETGEMWIYSDVVGRRIRTYLPSPRDEFRVEKVQADR